MKISELKLPYPVLGLGDEVSGDYSPIWGFDIGKSVTIITVKHSLNNSTLEKFIKSKSVSFCTEVHCPHTVFRKIFKTTDSEQTISIDSNHLRDKVLLTFFIIATQDNEKYIIDGSNQDFGDEPFLVEKGDVLAYGGKADFMAEKDLEGLKGSHPFLIIIEDENRKEGPFEVELDNHKLNIVLSKKDYKAYVNLPHKIWSPLLHTSLVLPALAQALQAMKNDPDAFSDLAWCQVLEKKMQEDMELMRLWSQGKALQVAQLLLQEPLTRAFACLEQNQDLPTNS